MPTNTQLMALITKLIERVDILEQTHISTMKSIEQNKPALINLEQKYPVPLDYRNIINDILNKDFGISVEPSSDRPMFTLRIVVPDKYSSLSEEEKKMMGADFRVKIVDYSSGANGVREYAELVYKSFNPEVQAMIVADRI